MLSLDGIKLGLSIISLIMYKIVCKQALLRQATSIFLFIVFVSQSVMAQTYMSKSLPKPQFYILGVAEKGFPSFNGDWSDSLNFAKYGNSIMSWINSNPEKWNSILESKNEYTQFNYLDFEKLDSEQKLKFKILSKQLAQPLTPQKENLMKVFYKKHPYGKTTNKLDFTNDTEQVYLLNIAEVYSLKSKLIH